MTLRDAVRHVVLWSAGVCLLHVGSVAQAQPEDFQGIVATDKYQVIYLPGRNAPLNGQFRKNSSLIAMPELEFTGPMPSHPFVLGNFYADGSWGIVDGMVQVIDGRNAGLQLAWADSFELEGVMELTGLGGWFMLLGWNDGRGFSVHNVTMRDSGSPWFLTEYRGNKAVEGRNQEFDPFEWKGLQPFRLAVIDQKLTLDIGRHRVFHEQQLEGYSAGRIILGVYDTKYGPRSVRLKSARIHIPKSAQKK